jgi:hypothetical protein
MSSETAVARRTSATRVRQAATKEHAMKATQILIAVTATSALFLASVPAATGGGGQAPFVPAHRHFLVTPEGSQPVGPQLCDDPKLQSAFNQFHAAVHVGPANTAFDHTHNKVDIRATGC